MTPTGRRDRLERFAKKLGPGYEVRTIEDAEVIFHMLGSGFNVELIEQTQAGPTRSYVMLLWFGYSILLATVHDIPETPGRARKCVARARVLTIPLTTDGLASHDAVVRAREQAGSRTFTCDEWLDATKVAP